MEKVTLTELEFHKLFHLISEARSLQMAAELAVEKAAKQIADATARRDTFFTQLQTKYPNLVSDTRWVPNEEDFSLTAKDA